MPYADPKRADAQDYSRFDQELRSTSLLGIIVLYSKLIKKEHEIVRSHLLNLFPVEPVNTG